MTTKPSVLLVIRAMKNDVGRGLKEDALTDLILLEGGGQSEHSFRFLRLSDGFAVFATPLQDRSKWYRQEGWPCAEKELVTRAIAQKYALEISEPPDVSGLSGEPRHHFGFHRAGNTIIVAHPKYLKILLPDPPVNAEDTLLEDLAALYKPTEQ